METVQKTEEQLRRERAIAWAKKLLESKRELEKEIEEDIKTPEYQEAIRKLRERNAQRGSKVVKV